jgi:hypothetical protein
MVVVAILSAALAPGKAYSQNATKEDERAQWKLSSADKRMDKIKQVGSQALEILRAENSCSAWFQEVDSDPAGVFSSLHFAIENDKPFHVSRMADGHGGYRFKQPWVARTNEYGGRNSLVEVNANSAFFNPMSALMDVGPTGGFLRLAGFQRLTVGSFQGNTTEAQITTLLHELGHVIGRIPLDGDSWDGRSSQNTEEVLRYCGEEIREAAQGNFHSGN